MFFHTASFAHGVLCLNGGECYFPILNDLIHGVETLLFILEVLTVLPFVVFVKFRQSLPFLNDRSQMLKLGSLNSPEFFCPDIEPLIIVSDCFVTFGFCASELDVEFNADF